MKIMAYGVRDYDEKFCFQSLEKEYGIEIEQCRDKLSLENVYLCRGCEYVSVMMNSLTPDILDALKERGVRMVSARTVGYDDIDCRYAKKIGLKVSNSGYSPDSVAEFTLMLMLMCLRKAKRMTQRVAINDFRLKGLIGDNLSDRKVGIIGSGSIGRRLAELLKGFGCEVYVFTPTPNYGSGLRYLELEELYRRCDIISLHAPLNESTYHMINRETLDMMPKGTIIINTSRGGLIDTDALIDSLRRGDISACGLDVIEGERDIFFKNKSGVPICHNALSVLSNMPNVVLTPHLAFYSHRSVEEMVRNSVLSCIRDSRGEDNPLRIV